LIVSDFDDNEPDPSDYDEPKPSQTKCRKCGAACTWLETLLLDGSSGRLHVCNVTDDFDDLTKAKP